ncbi:family 43 glycosylhydrolase [Paraprevotella clara]|uniref:family 43 glycosylhydrolase n=1 Tax=Paraprevotella clara TaxID=454154 RepID=UPI003AB80C20
MNKLHCFVSVLLFVTVIVVNAQSRQDTLYSFKSNGNPIITHKYTADPAPLVANDTLWLYTGHDFSGKQKGYKMNEWCVFSTTDMTNWTEHPTPLCLPDFGWAAKGQAYAGHVAERNGKYYFYVSTNQYGIGVAVSDRPEGPFKDILGKPLLTADDCFASQHSWACIDPAVFTDDDGQAWIFWGNKQCYYAKLKENMIEIDGEIRLLEFDGAPFEEAPWIHKYKGKYYLTYASGFPEKIAYAMADSITGLFKFKGILSEGAANSNTTHPAIVSFKGQPYFFTHNGMLPNGGSYSRSVCAEFLTYNQNGTIKKIEISTEGADPDFHAWDNANNPVIPGYFADPEIMYSENTGKYYLYPTTDGYFEWGGDHFRAFSSDDMKNWKDEGVILDFKDDLTWANDKAWAPAIIERKEADGYKYYYYFTADKKIGVAIGNSPTGPFKDAIGKPLIDFKPDGQKKGLEIDPDVFHDPVNDKYYLYWGNWYMGVVELNDDMISFDRSKVIKMEKSSTYWEGMYVFYRNGLYYFLWSENSTCNEDYRVRYATSKSPIGPLNVSKNNIILAKRPADGIFCTGHNSVICKPGTDEWYIVYHRFRRPNAIKMGENAGYHREVCIDRMYFNEDGSIKPVIPTL